MLACVVGCDLQAELQPIRVATQMSGVCQGYPNLYTGMHAMSDLQQWLIAKMHNKEQGVQGSGRVFHVLIYLGRLQ